MDPMKKEERRARWRGGGGEDGTRLFRYDMNFLITKAFAVISWL